MSDKDKDLMEKLAGIELFQGLKPKSEAALLEFKQFRVCEAGKVFVNQGEYTSEFCIILEGLVSAYRSEPGGSGVKRLGTLKPGDWFGEMSAKSNQPAMATIQADTRCVFMAIDPPLFKVLDAPKSKFKTLIDDKYRERALSAHLRAAPLFKGIKEEKLIQLQDIAEFVSFDTGKVIAAEGNEADAIYLIRSGAVSATCKDKETGVQRISAYFKDNSSFGECALSTKDRMWKYTYTTLGGTDTVKIPRDKMESIFEEDQETLQLLSLTADLLLSDDEGEATSALSALSDAGNAGALSVDQLEIMVQRKSVKGGEALVIDLKKCTRCNACVESCVAVHEDRVPRLSKSGSRISSDMVLSSACYNCDVPECMSACNDGAIRRSSRGQIQFIWDNCTGCSACTLKCPYGVIRMTGTDSPEQSGRWRSLFQEIPVLGKLFNKAKLADVDAPEETEEEALVSLRTGRKVKGKAIKCDLCAGLPFEACVYNCPCGAIDRINPEALFAAKAASN